MSPLKPNRRQILAGLAASVAIPALPQLARAQGSATLTVATGPVPVYLNAALSTGGGEAAVSGKMMDGLLTYGEGMSPEPQLAESWEVSEDGLTVTFKLRPGVMWHDGEPFTSEDVRFSVMEVLKVFHGRGRATFANVTEIETPDELTAVFKLTKPAPAMMSALNAQESPMLPAHVYVGTDIQQNPANLSPIGTGPYKFVSYAPGETLVMERNPDYWDEGKPLIDQLIFRYISDGSTRAAMLETGEADLVGSSQLPTIEILRFQSLDGFEVNGAGYEHTPSIHLCDFNLRRPQWQDKRVRQALNFAIDNKWVAENVWFGLASPGTGPLHVQQKAFYTTEGVPNYDIDLEKAEALLDEAGYPRGEDGWRFSMVIDAVQYGEEPPRAAEYMREQFREIGINAEARVNDFAAYVKRVYTDHDFDLTSYTASAGADPAIGVQRFYWSKNIKDGVPFSNGSGYASDEADALLEAAAVETDLEKRKQLYADFQAVAMEDVPVIQLVYDAKKTITSTNVKDYVQGALSFFGNFADVHKDA
ncbi:ABC transporter substrate-binding protein [Salipiger abyssi]|uniref:Peptide/nickel transport system substrate-binding protein n=1 Tax=Salipiger abyssi TaxID=1250539 RepID=A0A1P8UMH7_9RHOB|nr:ABC transporter substrate-binding protein [Salipiger abyssi]APZ50587.1 peptide/nickel transport system substrate-binding protein [Salipiger abyssi]